MGKSQNADADGLPFTGIVLNRRNLDFRSLAEGICGVRQTKLLRDFGTVADASGGYFHSTNGPIPGGLYVDPSTIRICIRSANDLPAKSTYGGRQTGKTHEKYQRRSG